MYLLHACIKSLICTCSYMYVYIHTTPVVHTHMYIYIYIYICVYIHPNSLMNTHISFTVFNNSNVSVYKHICETSCQMARTDAYKVHHHLFTYSHDSLCVLLFVRVYIWICLHMNTSCLYVNTCLYMNTSSIRTCVYMDTSCLYTHMIHCVYFYSCVFTYEYLCMQAIAEDNLSKHIWLHLYAGNDGRRLVETPAANS